MWWTGSAGFFIRSLTPWWQQPLAISKAPSSCLWICRDCGTAELQKASSSFSRMQDRRLSVYFTMLADLGFGSNWAKPLTDLRAAFPTPPDVSVLVRQCQHRLPLIPCRRPPPTWLEKTLNKYDYGSTAADIKCTDDGCDHWVQSEVKTEAILGNHIHLITCFSLFSKEQKYQIGFTINGPVHPKMYFSHSHHSLTLPFCFSTEQKIRYLQECLSCSFPYKVNETKQKKT